MTEEQSKKALEIIKKKKVQGKNLEVELLDNSKNSSYVHENKTIVLNGVNIEFKEEQIKKSFEKFGPIGNITGKVIKNKIPGEPDF